MVTPQEIIDKVVFGGLYSVVHGWGNGPYNDQCYNLAVPVMDADGKLWMQDTYQIERPSRKAGESENITDTAIRKICSFGEGYDGWCVKHARGNYYYKNSINIMYEHELENFKLICDLHDYRSLEPWEDYRDYLPEDIVHRAILFFEHNFSWSYGRAMGGTLVRKNAEKDPVKMLNRAIDDVYSEFKWPRASFSIHKVDEEMQRCIENGVLTEDLKYKANAAYTLNGKLEQMHNEFSKLYSKLN